MNNLDDLLKNNENKGKKPVEKKSQGQNSVTKAILNITKEQEAKEKELEAARLAEQEAKEKEMKAKEAELAAKEAELEAARIAEEEKKKKEEALKLAEEAAKKAAAVKVEETKEEITKENDAPAKKKKEKKASLLFKMDPEMKANLEVLADYEDRSLTNLIAQLCKNYISEERNKQIILEHKEKSL